MFCPKCNKPTFERLIGNQLRCQSCNFTYIHNVAAAVALIIRCDNQILFTKRALEPALGLLDLPGGFVDPGESLEQALKRELHEELNLDISKPKYLFSYPNQYLYKDVNYDTCDSFFEVKFDAPPKLRREETEILDLC
jgi:NADH pyrophosphatase NudC (nudix superfamily)